VEGNPFGIFQIMLDIIDILEICCPSRRSGTTQLVMSGKPHTYDPSDTQRELQFHGSVV
jgi:hypothetical protein